MPDLPKGCTWKRSPAGYKYTTPSASNPEYLVEFTTVGDRFAELEAYAGVLYVYEYGGLLTMAKKLKDKKDKVGKRVMKDYKNSLKSFNTVKVAKYFGVLDEDLCDNSILLIAQTKLLLDRQ